MIALSLFCDSFKLGESVGVSVQTWSQSLCSSMAFSPGQFCEGSHHEGVELGPHVCRRLAGWPGGMAVSTQLVGPLCCDHFSFTFSWLHSGSLVFLLGNTSHTLIIMERIEFVHLN